jgi:endonuclease/exonuclease/phosphatase (EEP) superfamily protein YafD
MYRTMVYSCWVTTKKQQQAAIQQYEPCALAGDANLTAWSGERQLQYLLKWQNSRVGQWLTQNKARGSQ